MDLGSLAVAAGVTATAAYLDAKHHISQDLLDIHRNRGALKNLENAAKAGRSSLWYQFEAQVKRLPANEQCLWSRSGCYTWQETHAHACRYAQYYISRGIKPGDLVAFYLMNSPEFIFAYLGSWAVGCAPAFINYNLTGDALVHCLKVSDAKILLVDEDEECRARIEDARARIEGELSMHICTLDPEMKSRMLGFQAKRPERKCREKITLNSPMCLVYTSGTTGMPKACSFPMIRGANIGEYRRRANGLKAGPGGDSWYDCMPLYHGTGNTVLVGCLITGQRVCIGRKFSVTRFWDDVHDCGATSFVYVGETARYLVNAPPHPHERDHNIKSVWGNGMRPDVWERFRQRFSIPTIVEFFNSTEGLFVLHNKNSGSFTATAVGHHGSILRRKLQNIYIPVALDHEKGDIYREPVTGFAKRVSYNEGGEILVNVNNNRSAFVGYWNNPSATAKKFLDDVFVTGDTYYRTGDALRRTDDGRWYFMDRLGDTFRWKGENVSTAEVADVLGRFPGVAEANVYGVEVPGHDGRAGCVALFVDPAARAGFDYAGLLKHARRALPRYAVPLFVRVIERQMLGHNNKQNKVPLRNEGVDLERIRKGTAGPEDKMMWLSSPRAERYTPFGPSEWMRLMEGKYKL